MEDKIIDFIKCKMDLETASTFLDEILEDEKRNLRVRANNTFIGKALYEVDEKRISVLTECKDNIDFVLDVLKDYINKENTQSFSPLFYKPKKFSSHSDLGKYQTEVIKAKKKIETLLWVSSLTKDEEKMKLYQECINKLNYVYSHISKKIH